MNDINNYSSIAAHSGCSPDTDHACLVAVGSVEFAASSSSSSSSSLTRIRKPRKKKSTKLISIMEEEGVIVKGGNYNKGGGGYKKIDTAAAAAEAPKITRPCTECGKKFWSWKALFGHMRCHPEREWRGINPPPNLIRSKPPPPEEDNRSVVGLTLEDHEVATCLLLLARSSSGREKGKKEDDDSNKVENNVECGSGINSNFKEEEEERFECSSCKKVFGSHQALGGHRASHKNVKGCFAITRTTAEGGGGEHRHHHDHNLLNINLLTHGDNDDNAAAVVAGGGGHKCSICMKVFSTGQALGGHKRCHWEKDESTLTLPVDLNLPAPVIDHCSNSTLTLDLRLGL